MGARQCIDAVTNGETHIGDLFRARVVQRPPTRSLLLPLRTKRREPKVGEDEPVLGVDEAVGGLEILVRKSELVEDVQRGEEAADLGDEDVWLGGDPRGKKGISRRINTHRRTHEISVPVLGIMGRKRYLSVGRQDSPLAVRAPLTSTCHPP